MSTVHLATQLTAQVARTPDALAVVDGDRRLSWAELAERVLALARGFRAEGLQPGDRLAIDLPNSLEWLIALLAAAEAGLVAVPLDPGLGYHELKYQLRHADIAGAVIPESGMPLDFLELFDELLPEVTSLRLITYVGSGARWFDNRAVPFEELLDRGRRHGEGDLAHDPTIPLAMLYTSGTMGKPKGVVLSHEAMLGCAAATADALGLGDDERVLVLLPLFHVFGLSVILTALRTGATMVLLPRFEAAEALQLIASEGITHLPGVPTVFELMMREPSFPTTALGSLRGGVVAGSVVAPALVDRIRRWCDVEVAYGLTEAGPTVSVTRKSDPPAVRRNSVGRPLDGLEVRVVDVRSGALHGVDAVGELAVRGTTLMQGYHRMPSETARSFTPEGFLLTGDLAHIDEGGVITIVARRREVIVRAGQTVTPREIEDVLRTHPGVEEACVVGVPHDVLGELVCACVVLVEGAVVTGQELRRFCQDLLASAKVPDLVRFFYEFPMTASGKVKRQELSRVIALNEG